MTRGSFYLLGEKKVYVSTEFNGGMYPGGNYEEAVDMLNSVESVSDFKTGVTSFNDTKFEYLGRLVFPYGLNMNGISKNIVDFRTNYYVNFNSDYIFIKNLSGRDYRVLLKDSPNDEFVKLPNGATMVFNFGKKVKEYLEQYN